MSIGINGLTPSELPMIQEAQQAQDGSGGNLGYFQRGKQKKKKEEDELDSFSLSSGEDSFGEEESEEADINLVRLLGDKIKIFFRK